MAENLMTVEPDMQFIEDIQRSGGDSLKKCFQCATCSVVCKETPDDKPFPRKEMIQAQWGQRDKLMSDPDVWLCHQCNDCTTNCPRGARPGDVLASIRNATFKNYAFPGFMGSLLSRPLYLPILLIVPMLILLGVVGAVGNWNVPVGEIEYDNFFPGLAIDAVFVTLFMLAAVSLFVGLNRFWKAMVKNHGENGLMGAPVPNLIAALPTILTHSKFKKCGEEKDRYWGHLGVFYGFVGAFIATALSTIYQYGFGLHAPYSTFGIIKFFGNIGAVGIIIGAFIIFVRRISLKDSISTYYDWTLIILVGGLGITGLATEVVRLAAMKTIAYQTYFIHLLFVFYLFAYIPFSKMAHIAYRTVAMTFARQAQRDMLTNEETA